MDLKLVSQYLEIGQYAVTFAGIPIAIWLYFREQRRERIRREEETFDQLDAAYCQFMNLCVENPELDIHETPRNGAGDESASAQRAEEAVFSILISLFERVWMAFENQHYEFRERMWQGWLLFMKSYVHRENFQANWKRIGRQFDTEFQCFMEALMAAPSMPDGEPRLPAKGGE